MSDMIFILVGLSLILLEMLVIPGFGIVGIGGIGFMLYGLYLLLLPEVPVGEEVLGQAMDGFLIGLVGAIIGILLLGKLMIRSKFWEQLTAPSSQKKNQGFSNSQGWEDLQGELAVTDTDLHPSGWINIDNQRIFVLSEGGFIEKGKEVTILSVDGNRVIVREL